MTQLLSFMGNHPFLTIGILLIVFEGLADICRAIRGKAEEVPDGE